MMSNISIPETYWNVPADELLARLGSSPQGLSVDAAAQRLAEIGPNVLDERRRHTAVGLFLNQFRSPIVLILLFATAVSALLRDWPDAVIILLIVLGSALLSFVQEYSASNAAQALRARITSTATVLRDDTSQVVPAAEVVPGDVLLLSAGSLVPADGVLLVAQDLFVDQAVLTGETFPVEKSTGPVAAQTPLAARGNCVFMGTNVRSGTARALIVVTAGATAFGQIAGRLAVRPPETEFERGIRRLGYLLSEVMFVLVLAVFALNVYTREPVIDSFLFSIALAVGLTPQLLPAIINVNLSKGAQRMAARGVIVRRLTAIENFGSMDVLCTDKTGTLTAGVVRLDGALNVKGEPSDEVLRYAYLNAFFESGLVNPLDQAIVDHTQLSLDGAEKLDEIPYDFVRKRLSVVVREPATDGAFFITKGALENVLAVSTQILTDGRTVSLDDTERAAIRQRYADWSAQGFRVLGIAAKRVPAQPTYTRHDESDLTFAGFLLFFDPPKAGVQDTIADLAALGVQVKIITGDNRLVAGHTAELLGLAVQHVITGAQLDDLHDDALPQAADRATIFAEVDPNQKERIIRALQNAGHVVGYMGDGINDAPPLHTADVGISVDTAVDVAKDAADFVLLEKSLAVLHDGIVQGRTTFANTLKYIFMATSANFGNMFSMAGASLFLPYLPMLPKQILLINFLTDLPEMMIAGDNVDESFIHAPHRWDISFIRRFMLVFGPLSSAFDYLTFGVLLYVLHAGTDTFRTGWFVESIVSAAVVVFVLRTRLPFLRSRPGRGMLLMTGLVVLVTVMLPYMPLAGALGFAPLTLRYLALLALIVAGYAVSAELTKHWFYRRIETDREGGKS